MFSLFVIDLAGVNMLLPVFWSDEFAQCSFRSMKLRKLKMRILNDPVVRTFVLGLYPEGMRLRVLYRAQPSLL